jgi:hypothetical protein
MKSDQLKRFLDSDVVGQLNNGLFFEGRVEDRAGRTIVFDREGQVVRRISATRVRWLAKAVRHC